MTLTLRAKLRDVLGPMTSDSKCDAVVRAVLEGENLVGAAEVELGRYVYRRIEALMDAKPSTPEGAELAYLAMIAESVEAYGEEACAGESLADFPG